MSVNRLIAPEEEPITLEEAKAYCRIDADLSAEDAVLSDMIVDAREFIEDMTSRALAPQTVERVLDGFPRERCIMLPRFPLIEVEEVRYDSPDGEARVFTQYDVVAHSMPGVISSRAPWPQTRSGAGSVRIRYRCGNGAVGDDGEMLTPELPGMARRAVLYMVNHMYEHREGVIVGRTAAELPIGISTLIRQLDIRFRP